MEFYKDKQSGEIVTEEEMLNLVDSDDNLDSFYLIGDFETKEEAQEAFDKNLQFKGTRLNSFLGFYLFTHSHNLNELFTTEQVKKIYNIVIVSQLAEWWL